VKKDLDMVIMGGLVVSGKGIEKKDVGVKNGRIEKVEDDLASFSASTTLNVHGKLILPGIIDVHTHPYYEDDFETLPFTAAWGGVTTLIHYAYAFPGMNAVETIEDAIEKGSKVSCLDFALHLGFLDIEEQYTQIPKAFPYGVRSFKMFMAYAKLGRMTTDYFLTAAMDLIAENKGIAMVHAENGLATDCLEEKFARLGVPALDAFTAIRPALLEAEAINRAISIARVCGCPVYIPHVSTEQALQHILRARSEGHTVYAETCPQYLLLTEEDLKFWGPLAKISPPPRSKKENEALWQAVKSGVIDCIGSDHAPKSKKREDDFSQAGYGSPQTETLFYTTYQAGVNGGKISLCRLVQVLCENPARIFGLYPQKGALAPGSDADMVLIDPSARHTLSGETQHTRAGYTLYDGLECHGRVWKSFQRGRVVYDRDKLLARPGDGVYLKQCAN